MTINYRYISTFINYSKAVKGLIAVLVAILGLLLYIYYAYKKWLNYNFI